jgi:hypothetical protein
MQGFIGQCTFTVKRTPSDKPDTLVNVNKDVGDIIEAEHTDPGPDSSKPQNDADQTFLLTLISRRSVKRAGLRYLRRGVDDEGNAANTVETEQILSSPDWSTDRPLYSVVQVRGSIPLYFSQSPYSFKPVPVLARSESSNLNALRTHFANLTSRYGSVQVASLVAKAGSEAVIGEAYERAISAVNAETDIKIGFEWFDFHDVCRGMHFENVSVLLATLDPTLSAFGHTTVLNNQLQSRQTGILRTNCMDCLDRTNVVQSFYGRKSLETQLRSVGISLDFQADTSTQWFNALWADNGDAISKQYTSTAALKGDYTRTRKRDYRGALNDIGLSVSRYFNNIVNDYFSQAAMDYLLGNVGEEVWEEFEAELMSGDPAMSMTRMRQAAVDNCARIVIEDKDEELVGGWTLLAPKDANTL